MSAAPSPPKILPFSDLYIRMNADGLTFARFKPDITTAAGAKAGPGNFRVPDWFNWYVEDVKEVILSEGLKRYGVIEYLGRRLRYVVIHADAGEIFAAVRSIPLDIPELDKLGISSTVLRSMKQWVHKKGHVIVSGTTGVGKTTTVVGLINHILSTTGGLAYTVEDPPEFAMQGAMGKGFVIQTPVSTSVSWVEALEIAMRSNPNILMFGEIRSSEAAGSLLLASGQLVLTTIHASGAVDTIAALMQKAETNLGESAAGKLADGLIAVVHQTLTDKGPRIELLEPESSDDPIRDAIRKRQYQNVKGVSVHEAGR